VKPPENKRHALFCQKHVEYQLSDRARAYKEAGYNPSTFNSAYMSASGLLSKPNLKHYIDWLLMQDHKSRIQLVTQVQNERARIAFSNIVDFIRIDEQGFVSVIDVTKLPRELTASIRTIWSNKKITVDENGNETVNVETKMELHSKAGSLAALEKQLGLDSDFNHAIAIFEKYGVTVKQNKSGDWYVERPADTANEEK